MTITTQLDEALDRLAIFTAGEHELALDVDSQRLECRLVTLDTLACAFTRLALRAPGLAGRSMEGLRKTAEQLAARLTYLLEPISPIEIDDQQCIVQMRSNPPQKDIDRATYYELLVSRGGEISLCRYARPQGQMRAIVAAHVTREVLLRLASDFSAAAS